MFGRHKFIVMEHEAGLLFRGGKLIETLAPGRYVKWGPDYQIERYDIRITQLAVANQEIACTDGISLRVSAKVEYRIVDVETAYRSANHIVTYIYELAHDALREVLGAMTVDDAMAKRAEHSAQLTELIRPRAALVGVEISNCTVRDLSVSGEIKRAFGQVVVAQKEAEAALERARGETAALRSLSNAAKLMDSNPNLLQLRWIHAMGQAKGATIVLSPSGMIPATQPETTDQ
jgi:regulator of protease activity HflC (stomatin/prohibitin superfamily)